MSEFTQLAHYVFGAGTGHVAQPVEDQGGGLALAPYYPPNPNRRPKRAREEDDLNSPVPESKFPRASAQLAVRFLHPGKQAINLKMPYARRTYTRKRRGTGKYAASTQKKVKSIVRRTLNASHVTRCTTYGLVANGAPSPTGQNVYNATGVTYAVLNGVPVGNNESSRTGPKIKEISLQLMGWISMAAAGAVVSDCCRFVLVRDHDGTGTPPAYSDIFDTSNMVTDGQEIALPRFANRKRFSILLDVCIPINNLAVGQNTLIPVNMHVKLNKTLTYSADQSLLQDGGLRDGPIYLFQCSKAAATDLYTFDLNGQFKFKQL